MTTDSDVPFYRAKEAEALVTRGRAIHQHLESGWTLAAIAEKFGIRSVNGIYRAALSPDARVVEAVPEGWAGIFTAARKTGTTKHIITRLAKEGRLSVLVCSRNGRLYVNTEEVLAVAA